MKACCATRGVLEAEGPMHPALRKARGEAAALSKQFQDRRPGGGAQPWPASGSMGGHCPPGVVASSKCHISLA